MAPVGDRSGVAEAVAITFDDNTLLPVLFGVHGRNLDRISHQIDVTIAARGNEVVLQGAPESVSTARSVLRTLWSRICQGQDIDDGEVDAVIRLTRIGSSDTDDTADGPTVRTRLRTVRARTETQKRYLEALRRHPLVFGLGPAGTGKTYLAVAQALSMLADRTVGRIVLSRPAVEAGERLGFLPGDLREKIAPYLQPLYDALHDMMPRNQVAHYIEDGIIEIAPLAFMRGRTLSNAYVILDEAQNTTTAQMRMFLTRLGQDARMAVTGDLSQIDLPPGQTSGLAQAVDILKGMPDTAMVRFDAADVVRHPLVGRIVDAYAAADDRRRAASAEGGA